jgi:hypothetical protein
VRRPQKTSERLPAAPEEERSFVDERLELDSLVDLQGSASFDERVIGEISAAVSTLGASMTDQPMSGPSADPAVTPTLVTSFVDETGAPGSLSAAPVLWAHCMNAAWL